MPEPSLGECSLISPCQTMHGALKEGSVIRDWSGALRLGGGDPLLACPWCSSGLVITPEVVKGWDWGSVEESS